MLGFHVGERGDNVVVVEMDLYRTADQSSWGGLPCFRETPTPTTAQKPHKRLSGEKQMNSGAVYSCDTQILYTGPGNS